MNKRTQQRVTRILPAIASFGLAWWLFQTTGGWSRATSLSEFLLFLFCVLGIDRIVSAAIDLVTIAFGPTDTIKQRH